MSRINAELTWASTCPLWVTRTVTHFMVFECSGEPDNHDGDADDGLKLTSSTRTSYEYRACGAGNVAGPWLAIASN
jgi:hypothetical protein